MIKLHASYSKKIPAETEYSSKSFHASLEVEVADTLAQDGDMLQEKLRTLWQDLQDAVESQIEQSNGNGSPARNNARTDTADNSTDRISPKQVSYLTLLAKRVRNWGLPELEKHIRTKFGNGGLYQISKQDASTMIEELQALQGKGNSAKRARR